MSMVLLFNRKVIPLPAVGKDAAKVECEIVGYLDGEHTAIGEVNFPSKQTWTKFWGALQRGALAVPNLEVKMENVMPGEEDLVDEKGKKDDKDKSPGSVGKPSEPIKTTIGAVDKPSQGGSDAPVK